MQLFGNLLAATGLSQAARHQSLKVRSPLSEIIVDVDDRKSGCLDATLELRNAFRCREDSRKHLVCILKGKLVDHVDDQQARVCTREGRRWFRRHGSIP